MYSLYLNLSSSFYSQQGEINWMHKFDVHEAFHQKCEVHGPCVGGSGPRAGPIYNEDI